MLHIFFEKENLFLPDNLKTMYLISKTYCTSDMKVSAIVKDNPLLLLVLENFSVTEFDRNITISEQCKSINVNENLFLLICNLHNGFYIDNVNSISKSDLKNIISYLKKGHIYYVSEKYPEILQFIKAIIENEKSTILSVIETYFNEYFDEVKEHINYEEKIAFPYFLSLLNPSPKKDIENYYSSNDYQEHHTDIETLLNSFRDLIIQHVHFEVNNKIKRKLLMSLSELEFELKIHSHIEYKILIPLTKRIEKEAFDV